MGGEVEEKGNGRRERTVGKRRVDGEEIKRKGEE